MPTNRRVLSRPRRQLDEYEYSELLTLRSPLIAGTGFWKRDAPGLRVADQRDEDRMRELWRTREVELVTMWVDGWRPQSPFAGYREIGCPGSRPPGWWKFANRHPRKSGDDQPGI